MGLREDLVALGAVDAADPAVAGRRNAALDARTTPEPCALARAPKALHGAVREALDG